MAEKYCKLKKGVKVIDSMWSFFIPTGAVCQVLKKDKDSILLKFDKEEFYVDPQDVEFITK